MNEQMQLAGFKSMASMRARFDDGTYPIGFWEWLESNQHILTAFLRLATKTQKAGIGRWSADAICHVLRWQIAIREKGQNVLKINNNATAGLARLAIALRPELQTFLITRTPPARNQARRLDGSLYRDEQ